MRYQTQHGEVPSHLMPQPYGEMHARFIVRVERGESIPRPGSTKHLLHGPKMVLTQGWESIWYDLPPQGEEHQYIREVEPHGFRDDEHFALFVEGTPVLPLTENADEPTRTVDA